MGGSKNLRVCLKGVKKVWGMLEGVKKSLRYSERGSTSFDISNLKFSSPPTTMNSPLARRGLEFRARTPSGASSPN